jgi:hypothetical protein
LDAATDAKGPAMSDIDRLDVHVDSAPHPGLIRPRIEAALAGRASAPSPEQAIGQAVAAAVAAARGGSERNSRKGASS